MPILVLPGNVRAAKKTQVPPPPEEMVDIAYNTMLSAAIGALFEGSRRRLDDKSGKAMSSPHAKQHVRAIAEANKQRLANVARAGLQRATRSRSSITPATKNDPQISSPSRTIDPPTIWSSTGPSYSRGEMSRGSLPFMTIQRDQ